MKHFVLYILLLFAGKLTAQDSLIISNHRLLYVELKACKHAKNQLSFLDSLISLTTDSHPPYKGDRKRFLKLKYEKLVIYHIDAGWICRLRKDLNQAHEYLAKGESYLDSLHLFDLYDDELANTLGAYNNMQQQICFETYRKDTALFYAWDCAKFFPELHNETTEQDTLNQISTNRETADPGKKFSTFYVHDTLRINPQFTSDSLSISYLEETKDLLLQELKVFPIPQLYLELKMNNNKPDTLIYKVDLEFTSDKIVRGFSVAYSSCDQYTAQYYMKFLSSISYLNAYDNVSFFIPIILRPETPNNYNKMHRIAIEDGYFLIEYETPKPIQTD